MKEFKGKCEWGITWIVIGIVALVFTVYFSILFAIGGRYGLFGGLLISILAGAFFGSGAIAVIVAGISHIVYSRGKVVLRIYSQYFEFIRRNKFFNNDWEIVKYSEINTFSVSKFGLNEESSKFNETEAGTIEFKIGKEGKSVCVDVEHCLEAAELIKEHLDPRQIEGFKKSSVQE